MTEFVDADGHRVWPAGPEGREHWATHGRIKCVGFYTGSAVASRIAYEVDS